MTVEDAARHLSVGVGFVKKLIKQQELVVVDELAKPVLIRREDLDFYIASCRCDRTVYVVQMERAKYVKIGITDVSAASRIAGLSTGNPEKINLLATFIVNKERGLAMERALHRALKDYRAQGEWFHDGPWLPKLLAARKRLGVSPAPAAVVQAVLA